MCHIFFQFSQLQSFESLKELVDFSFSSFFLFPLPSNREIYETSDFFLSCCCVSRYKVPLWNSFKLENRVLLLDTLYTLLLLQSKENFHPRSINQKFSFKEFFTVRERFPSSLQLHHFHYHCYFLSHIHPQRINHPIFFSIGNSSKTLKNSNAPFTYFSPVTWICVGVYISTLNFSTI